MQIFLCLIEQTPDEILAREELPKKERQVFEKCDSSEIFAVPRSTFQYDSIVVGCRWESFFFQLKRVWSKIFVFSKWS